MFDRRSFFKKSMLVAAGATVHAAACNSISDVDKLDDKIVSLKRNVPVNYEADVVVIGGGIAGVSEFLSIQIHIS